MELLSENRPETCSSLGLECSACVRQAAATMAAICGGLQPTGVRQIFFQLYPSAGCQPMALAFERAYLDAMVPSKPVVLAVRADAAAAA